MVYREMALMLTDKCTAECAFCALKCNPGNTGLLSLETAKKVIDGMKRVGSFNRVGLSGGEPFLYPELIRDILLYAKEAGIEKRTVATNGFWGAWDDERIDRILGGLEGILNQVSISHDAFHAEYVKTDYVWRVLKALDRHGIESTIHVGDVYGEKGAGEFLASLDGRAMYKSYTIYRLAPFGAAENLPGEYFVRPQKWDEVGCFNAHILAMGCDGTVYPCCSPGIFGTEFKLGNIHDTEMDELLENSPGKKYINVMAHPDRFSKLLHYAKEELGVSFPEKVVGGCESCYLIFKEPGVFEKLRPFVEKEYKELILEKLLGTETGV